MQLTTCSGASALRSMIALHQLGGRVEDLLGVVALDADGAAQGEESHGGDSVRARAQRARSRRVAQPPVRAGRKAVQAQRAEARRVAARRTRMTDRLAHAPHLAVASLVDRQLEHVRPHAPHARGRGGTVLELHARRAARAERLVRRRPAAERRAVGLGHLEARVRQPVGELAVVGEQDQPAAVGVQAPDRVQAQPARAGTSSTTVGRPWVSCAVETTPTGLFSA